ncbi:CPBP family intramembrane glutamic endopeptidase [uncultured Clostridium sp.]|jgi:hypothetical protein|uniref:CPBP family intramembrane glutamic endopeptidase n=1 Tax=uncultured Clostridium sp. TaxID=59620 RepID=UPI0026172AB6|nr:CPBP family intramembrane glutamic endopeptidase [uncultured Clostridium sp.]
MKFLKDIIDNKIEIKPLSIFKIILAYIAQNIFTIPFLFVFTIGYGVYLGATTPIGSAIEVNYIVESLLFSLAAFIGLLITIKVFSVKKRKKQTDPNFGYEYIEDVETKPRQEPLKLNVKIVRGCIFLAMGYLFFEVGTLGHFTATIEISAEITAAFEKILEQNLAFILFSIVIEAAFVEEILCRSLILNGLLNKYSPKIAILISALFFGIIHMNIPQFIGAALIGILWGTLYYQTRSLKLCMIVHATNNFLVFFLVMPETPGLKIIYSIIYIIVGLILFVKGFNDLNLMKTVKEFFPKKEKQLA